MNIFFERIYLFEFWIFVVDVFDDDSDGRFSGSRVRLSSVNNINLKRKRFKFSNFLKFRFA